MKTKPFKFTLSVIASGLVMTVMAGVWHNLVLPTFDSSIKAHHDGILIMFIAYFILAGLMTYLFNLIEKDNKIVLTGLKAGILVGILWVFPHGLVMAGAHDTSILYEIGNTLWHMVEQGAGGVIIALIQKSD